MVLLQNCPLANKGHSLSLGKIKYGDINGFIHTHLNDFPTGEIDTKTGKPKMNIIYRMFSPADVIAFLNIVKASSDVSKTYATVITSSGDYTLKFTGNVNDIKGIKEAKDYREDYIELYRRI